MSGRRVQVAAIAMRQLSPLRCHALSSAVVLVGPRLVLLSTFPSGPQRARLSAVWLTHARAVAPGVWRLMSLFLGRSMSVADSDNWIACTARPRLRLLRADDAVPLRSVMEPGLVAAAAQAGSRALTPWAIVLRDGGGIAGFCGFLVRPVKGTTMGYGIVPEYRGRGLATEAAAAVLDWAERNGVDFYSSVRPPNPASVRVLERSECGWSTLTPTKTGSATSTAASRCASSRAPRPPRRAPRGRPRSSKRDRQAGPGRVHGRARAGVPAFRRRAGPATTTSSSP